MPTANAMATYSQARGVRPSTELRRPDEGGGTDEDIRWTGSGGSPHSGIAPQRAIHGATRDTRAFRLPHHASHARSQPVATRHLRACRTTRSDGHRSELQKTKA